MIAVGRAPKVTRLMYCSIKTADNIHTAGLCSTKIASPSTMLTRILSRAKLKTEKVRMTPHFHTNDDKEATLRYLYED